MNVSMQQLVAMYFNLRIIYCLAETKRMGFTIEGNSSAVQFTQRSEVLLMCDCCFHILPTSLLLRPSSMWYWKSVRERLGYCSLSD